MTASANLARNDGKVPFRSVYQRTDFDSYTGDELEFALSPEQTLITAFERIQLANPDPCTYHSSVHYRFRTGTRTLAPGRFIALKETRRAA